MYCSHLCHRCRKRLSESRRYSGKSSIDKALKRTTPFLTHEVFSKYHTETEMMRYIKRLDRKDISLAQSMISLGSCTMKLNAAAEMLPLSRPEFMGMHPLVPEDQAEGYRELIKNLSEDLKVITGFAGVSLQPTRVLRRICRTSCNPCLSRKYRSGTSEQSPDSGFSSRNKSCVSYTGRICDCHLCMRRTRKCRNG